MKNEPAAWKCDRKVQEFAEAVLAGNPGRQHVVVSEMPQKAAEEILRLTGKSTGGFQIVLDVNAVKHIMKRHGANGKHDQSIGNTESLARIGHIIRNYDDVIFEGSYTTGYLDEAGKPAPLVQFRKQYNGSFYVIVACASSKKKRVYVVTAFVTRTKEKQSSNPC